MVGGLNWLRIWICFVSIVYISFMNMNCLVWVFFIFFCIGRNVVGMCRINSYFFIVFFFSFYYFRRSIKFIFDFVDFVIRFFLWLFYRYFDSFRSVVWFCLIGIIIMFWFCWNFVFEVWCMGIGVCVLVVEMDD